MSKEKIRKASQLVYQALDKWMDKKDKCNKRQMVKLKANLLKARKTTSWLLKKQKILGFYASAVSLMRIITINFTLQKKLGIVFLN